ncbi:MAG: glycine cleavage system protein GcvH [Verrucomicrobiae bacterium]|nr:glycine cleavage system protein GcvH [Verrucomicrobiae bacterium]
MSTNVPSDLKYTETHEWVKVGKKDNIVTVGLTDYAQEELTDIVYLDLPKVGDEVEEGTECGVVESVKAANDIYAPVSGTVVEVNTAAVENPSLVNEEPYGKGWLFKIKMVDPKELDDLMSDSEYEEKLAEEDQGDDEEDEDEK